MFPTTEIADHTALGHLKLAICPEGNPIRSIEVRVELRWTGYIYPEREAALRTRLRDRLLTAHPALRAAVCADRVSFEVTTALPGSLNSFYAR